MLTSSHFCLLLFLGIRICMTYSQLSSCLCNGPDPIIGVGVNLVYYKCNNDTPATIEYPLTAPEGLIDVLNANQRTIFYVFGYLQYQQDPNVVLMMKALCSGNTDNIVLLDWSKYSTDLYEISFVNAEQVATLFALAVQKLVNVGLDVSNIYLIGHSLGSHIVGLVGKCSNFTIPRITGLDPANRVYYPIGCYLTSKDATLVDVIHTDIGWYGTTESMGTAEYYANEGTRPQPGCAIIGVPGSECEKCSHQRSVQIYAESKLHPEEFIAVECSDYNSFKSNLCNNNKKTGVGYAASNVTGKYYFTAGQLSTCSLLHLY